MSQNDSAMSYCVSVSVRVTTSRDLLELAAQYVRCSPTVHPATRLSVGARLVAPGGNSMRSLEPGSEATREVTCGHKILCG
jgi:hypothetical protein